MPKIREILSGGSLGLIPKLLADQDAKKQGVIAKLMGENEALREQMEGAQGTSTGMKKGGKVKKMAAGGSVSKRADGCAVKGKTRGKMV